MNVLSVVLTVLFLLFLDAVGVRVFVCLCVCVQLFGVIQFPLFLAFNSFNLVYFSRQTSQIRTLTLNISEEYVVSH